MTVSPTPTPAATVEQVSESELLKAFLPLARTSSPYVEVGPGDDCAVVAVPQGRVVITTDTQVVDQDFRVRWPNGYETTGADTAHKCAAQNLADIASMGAVPTSMVVSLTLPGDTPVRWVRDFATGLTEAFVRLGAADCALVGGDLGRGRELSVTATVLGVMEHGDPVLRSGAGAGGTVVHAGVLGHAAAGLCSLEAPPGSGWDRRPRDERRELERAQLRPHAPITAGPRAARAGASAMIDISDGLLRDAGRVARASGVVIDLDPAALEESVAMLADAGHTAGVDPWRWVLTGGEDHGLLAVVAPDVQVPPGMRAIGSCAPADRRQAFPGDRAVTIAGQDPSQWLGYDVGEGWDHFEP
ncbi:thiamine-phosphate kinase [Kocuria sp. cx-455]|uniref:thiamine-phosphate kinase n=1 Tax=Kocuria sp. cx-455 TaxID=2771377 RepID=UPI003D763422